MYEFEAASNGIMFIPDFVKISQVIQMLTEGHTDKMVISKAYFHSLTKECKFNKNCAFYQISNTSLNI
jgi:hypothetical protein